MSIETKREKETWKEREGGEDGIALDGEGWRRRYVG